MSISVTSNIPALVVQLNRVVREQVPFATAVALTRTGIAGRDAVRADLPHHFTIRRSWVRNGIVTVSARKADWPSPYAVVASRDDFMLRQEEGGTKVSRSGGNLAIPLAARPTPQTITPQSKWPSRLLNQGGDRKYFVQTMKKGRLAGKQAIVRRLAPGSSALQVMYVLQQRIDVPKRWNFREKVEATVQRVYADKFISALDASVSGGRR